MKKLFLSVFIVLATSVTTNAQTKSIDLDNLRYRITYRLMPSKPLEPLFFTYSAFVNSTKVTEQRVSLFEIEDAVYIAGQRKVRNDENPFLTVVVNLGDLIIKSSSINERREEQKSRDGKVTGVNYYYKVVVEYTFDSSYKIVKGDNVLFSSVSGANFYFATPYSYQSQEYRSRKDAADFWHNNKDVLISQFTSDLSRKTAADAGSRASSLYGFPVIKTTDIIQETDEKKHSENEAFRAACASLKDKLEAVTADKGLNKKELEGIIEYFKSIPTKYTDPKLKADIKLRYASYYNLCKLYLYLDDPDSVYPYADLIIQNDYDKKDGEKFKKAADELKEQLSRTVIKTRHFNPDSYFRE